MSVINMPRATDHVRQVSDAEKYIGQSEAKFNLILSEIIGDQDQEAHQAESRIFSRLSELGFLLMKLFFANHGKGGLRRNSRNCER